MPLLKVKGNHFHFTEFNVKQGLQMFKKALQYDSNIFHLRHRKDYMILIFSNNDKLSKFLKGIDWQNLEKFPDSSSKIISKIV